jgi:hypothetical protein
MSATAQPAANEPTEWRVDTALTRVSPLPTVAGDVVIVDQQLRAHATTLCLAVVETVTGDRSLTQLTRWLTPDAYDRLAADIGTPPTVGQQRPRLLSVHVSTPTAGVAEVCGRVRSGGRSRALALRLEQQRGRWVCTALQLG